MKLVDDLARGGHDLGHFCRELVERARELLLLRSSSEAAAVLDLSEAEAAEARQARRGLLGGGPAAPLGGAHRAGGSDCAGAPIRASVWR